MVKVFGKATIKHPEIGETYEIEGKHLDFEEVGRRKRSAGIETQYSASFKHYQLGELVWLLWEYPDNVPNLYELEPPHELVEDNFHFNFSGDTDPYTTNYLKEIHPNAIEFDYLILLDVNIEDYSDDIINEDYMLLRVDERIHNVLSNLWAALSFDSDADKKLTSRGKYIFAKKNETGSEFGVRVVAYLNNRFGNSLYFSDVGLVGINIPHRNIIRMDWTELPFKKGDTLNITLEDFGECIAILKYTGAPSRDDIDVNFIFEELEKLSEAHLFRGVDKFYGKNDGMASSIYRENKGKIIEGKLQEYEEGIIERFSNYGVHTNIVTLAEIRHAKQDTSLVDFTKNPKIALFFACQKTDNTEAMGEIIYFHKETLNKKDDIQYPIQEDFVICSVGGPISAERIKAQESVFVYAHQGYLPRNKYQKKFQHLLIDPSLKKLLFGECGFRDFNIYPDVLGFTDNTNNFEIPTNLLTPYARIKDCCKNILSKSKNGYEILYLLDVNIKNYEPNITKEDYTLLRIDKKIEHLIFLSFCDSVSDIDGIITNSKYALMVNVINLERIKCFDNNFKKSISFTWNFVDGNWTKQSKRTTTVDITLEEIENMVKRC